MNNYKSLVRHVICGFLLAVAYLAGGRFGLALSDPISHITLVWPATGIAVAALVRLGFWCWPGVFLGALLVERSVDHSWLAASGIAVGNTVGPMVAAWVLNRGRFDPAFERRRDLGIFCLAAMVGMLFSAGGGTLNLCVSGRIPWSAFGPAALRWWLGDSGGVLLVGPLLLGLRPRELSNLRGRVPEFFALCVATFGGGWLVFMRSGASVQVHPTTAFAVLPLVVWGALRFGMAGASASACGLALMGAWGTSNGRGEFYLPDMQHGTLMLWWFIMTSGFLGLVVTILLAEQSKVGFALRESEERLRLLISGVKDYAIFMLEPDGRVASWNPEAERITGYRTDEIVGQGFARFFSAEDISHGRPRQQLEVAQGTGRFEEEGWRVRKDGSRFWARGTVAAVYDETRRLRGFAKVTQDLTERKAAEEALHQSEERYRSVVATLAEGILLEETGGRIVACNASAERILGRPGSQLIGRISFDSRFRAVGENGQPFEPALHPDSVALRTGQPQSGVILGIHRPDGELVWLSINARPLVHVGETTPYAVVCSFVDVTARKRAEVETEQQRARMAGIVSSAMDGIITVDESQNIVVFNPAAERMFGCPAAEVLDRPVKRLLPECQPGSLAGWLGPNRAFTGRRADGGEFPVEASVSAIELAGRKLFTVTCRDVTSLRKAENERQRLEAQLRQSQKMEAIGQLSGGIAHDFNNLLTIIQGNVALLKATRELSPDIAQLIDDIAQSGERAARLTGQLLAFSRQQALQMQDVDLNDTVANMTRILQRILGEDIRTRVNFASRALYLHADAGMLDQVLLNLAVNARDAMPRGGTLKISTAIEELDAATVEQRGQGRPGLFACLTVSDTGTGIPADILPRIFEPFFTTKEFGKGSGLGLATVYGIVQQHQGWVEVASEMGHGTTFRVYLPCLGGEGGKIAPAAPAPAAPRGGGETILLVEDEPALRLLAQKVLEQLGYTVYDAANGLEALSVWEEHRREIQLLLTDIVMPDGLNGIELASQLRGETPALKVLYMSGYSADFAGRDVQLEDGVNFLSKPFNPARLGAMVRAVLDAPRATGE